jgi:hypothetical protein
MHISNQPKAFVSRAQARKAWGFNITDDGSNHGGCQRTQRDICLDGVDHYDAMLQLAGKSTIIQNEKSVKIATGDVVLVVVDCGQD